MGIPVFPEFMRVILATLAIIKGGEDISRYETLCLSKAIYYEARNQDIITQISIASFVHQFAQRNGTTICEEIYHSPGVRYPWTKKPLNLDNEKEHDAWEQAALLSVLTINGVIRYDINDATHFIMPYIIKRLPDWYDSKRVVLTVGVVEYLRLLEYQ